MSAPIEIVLCADSAGQLWNCAVLELHFVLNGEYILGAQLGKNFNVWEIQRKVANSNYCNGILEVSVKSQHFLCICKYMTTLTPEPRHVLCRHSLPITDIHCGLMGPQSRVATASLDQTVKPSMGIMSVTLDPCEYCLFCGGSDGGIFQVSLCSQVSLSRDKTFRSDNEGNQVFKGHRLVTCLSVSMDGTLLLSGSHDETIRLWDIQSNQSIRSINHKVAPGIPLPRFSRHLNPLVQAEGTETGGALNETYLEKADKLYSLMTAVTDKCVFVNGENTKVRVSELEEEVRALKKVNKDLYDFSTQLLTKPS
uniref:WD repeat-containing protein 18 n=1 Tax=Oncorhynchus mykiss TaxID=8022 RepID=A0A8C7NDI6_ONCMY